MAWSKDDPQGNEAGKVKYDIVQYTRGKGLDIGCGPHKAYPHFIGVDSKLDTALFGIQMKPDIVADCLDLAFKDASMDFVFSSHLLEHIEDTHKALAEWWRVIKVGGHLVVYLPHRDLYPNVGKPGANPDHKHDFTEKDIALHMARVAEHGEGWDLIVSERRDAGTEYSFLQVYRKRDDPQCHNTFRAEKPKKTACVVRYGGFGDQLQAANLLPELKRQGYHVTFMTVPKGQDILRHDPHIDAWFIQDTDQVPNGELGAFWKTQAGHFDRFINLCESVEGALLAQLHRIQFTWPASMRRKHMNVNYLEFTADIAELPYKSESRFYATEAEQEWARDFIRGRFEPRIALRGEKGAVLKDIDGSDLMESDLNRDDRVTKLYQRGPIFTVVWALAGSSVHKFMPHQDTIIMRMLLAMPEVRLIFVGDEACQILEAGWEAETRVRCMSNKLTIRETLALAQAADLVIGPETGVLNAVAFEDNAKVVFLSHSSKENLTKHWVNTFSAIPNDTPCYPCHQMQEIGRDVCPRGGGEDINAAICQWNINRDEVTIEVLRFYQGWGRVQKLRLVAA